MLNYHLLQRCSAALLINGGFVLQLCVRYLLLQKCNPNSCLETMSELVTCVSFYYIKVLVCIASGLIEEA